MRIITCLFTSLIFLNGCLHLDTKQETQLVSFKAPSALQPDPAINIQREGYSLAYDGRIRGAAWVYEELTAASLENNADRSHFDFMEDPQIPLHLRSTKDDYKGSGYDRGHLRPAANAKNSADSMRDTFYLSNISPQDPQLNRKYWLKLEKYVRALTKSHDVVYVITGPLFMPQKGDGGKRFVQYEVIGKNDIAVPTHYFKMLQAKKGGSLRTEAYIIPNEPVDDETPLKNFSVTQEKVARAAGISFSQNKR
jgi:endonuclease G